jgi:hypothetical protein
LLTGSLPVLSGPAIAQTETAKPADAGSDSGRLKLADQVVAKLIPTGTYKNIMKDMMDTMAGGLIEQMMGMDASVIAGMAGAESGSAESKEAAGKTMADIAAEKDPNFKERMDITMKVMFAEMGDLMSEMEPSVRTAMSNIYFRKYSAKELADMNIFFATPSGTRFASNFMATFTDKEMIQASFGMMPKVVEAMPAIMKKVEAATAHLPPLPQTETETPNDAVTSAANAETGNEPWYAEDNWTVKDRNRTAQLSNAYLKASEKSESAYNAFDKAQNDAIDAARERFLANGWKADDGEQPMAAEDIPANAVPPPVLPK